MNFTSILETSIVHLVMLFAFKISEDTTIPDISIL